MTTPNPVSSRQASIAAFIDHTCLTFSPGEGEESRIARLCSEAKENGFYAVCVRPQHVSLAKRLLKESPVKVAVVVGFPQEKVALEEELRTPTIGGIPIEAKVAEARQAVLDGADELDLVIPVGTFKQESAKQTAFDQSSVLAELSDIRQAAPTQCLKVILETDLLTDDEINLAAILCAKAGVNMLKTSTGMVVGGKGATVEVVRKLSAALLQPAALEGQTTGEKIGIKASGGIKSQAQALDLLKAGATRLGTSAGIELLSGERDLKVSY